VDVVIPQNTSGPQNNRKIILIIIAIYGTVQLFIKAVLAIFYHFKWLFFDCRCCNGILYPDRLQKVKNLWRTLDERYKASQLKELKEAEERHKGR
jgi:hypothetical protein